MCTGWSTYPGACFGSVFQEQAPSCVLAFISNWFDMREQALGANLLHESVSGVGSLVCTEVCFEGACFRSKLLRVFWLEYLPGRVFRERVSGASSLVCTGLKEIEKNNNNNNNNNTTTKTNWTKELKPQTRQKLMQFAPRICGSLISCLILV